MADVDALCSQLSLGENPHQMRAVRHALDRVLNHDQKGVVLADEVGCGKTYEALAIMALLCLHYRRTGRNRVQRVLVLCKPSLLRKWHDELTELPERGLGFRQYVTGSEWSDVKPFLDPVMVRNMHSAASLEGTERGRGTNVAGRRMVQPGLWLVNQNLLADEGRRGQSQVLWNLFRTRWDLVIADEAHHHGKGSKCAACFSPKRTFASEDLARGLDMRYCLLLTATPFELDTQHIVSLIRILRAPEAHVAVLEEGLARYERELGRLFADRSLPQDSPRRRGHVEKLERMRTQDCLDRSGASEHREPIGLQALLRRYVIRNVKDHRDPATGEPVERRQYFLWERSAAGATARPFGKFDHLQRITDASPLLPFRGPDVLYYFQLREAIHATLDAEDGSRSFVTTDLRQGLSSFPQVLGSSLVAHHPRLPAVVRLRQLVQGWQNPDDVRTYQRLHPKVAALAGLVGDLLDAEIAKLRDGAGAWLSKIVVFNKLVSKTAPQLRAVLENVAHSRVTDLVKEQARAHGWASAAELRAAMRTASDRGLNKLKRRLSEKHTSPHTGRDCAVLDASTVSSHVDRRHEGRHLVDILRRRIVDRCGSPLCLLHFLRESATGTQGELTAYLGRTVMTGLWSELDHLVDQYLDDTPREDMETPRLRRAASERLARLKEHYSACDLVARLDGEQGWDPDEEMDRRSAHQRNFNDLFAPLVLIVSRVGEEGIDLQKHCRYIIHYDLEWNPAKMEQREGRVDRTGWGRAGEGYIDVRFMLLKGTYEERIFHTVMQRDVWFQVLIGSKKRALGQLPRGYETALDDEDPEEQFAEDETVGRLAPEERNAIVLDLTP